MKLKNEGPKLRYLKVIPSEISPAISMQNCKGKYPPQKELT